MQHSSELLSQLRNTIGTQVEYNGVPCAVVELLEEPLCLVLQALGPRRAIQESQYGRPQRWVTPIFTIPCLSEEAAGVFHPELLALGLRLE